MVAVRYNPIYSSSHNGGECPASCCNSLPLTANSLQPPHAPVSAPTCLLLCKNQRVRVECCAYVVLPRHHMPPCDFGLCGCVVLFLQPCQLRRVAYAGAAVVAAAAGASVAAYIASAPRVRFRVADIPRLQRTDSTVSMGAGEPNRQEPQQLGSKMGRTFAAALLAAGSKLLVWRL